MKTAEEWQNEYWKLELAKEPLPKNERWPTLIHAIQLDAMKEGMRRAARINRGNMDKWRLTKTKDMGAGAEVAALDIFNAAEQLTEKDLV